MVSKHKEFVKVHMKDKSLLCSTGKKVYISLVFKERALCHFMGNKSKCLKLNGHDLLCRHLSELFVIRKKCGRIPN